MFYAVLGGFDDVVWFGCILVFACVLVLRYLVFPVIWLICCFLGFGRFPVVLIVLFCFGLVCLLICGGLGVLSFGFEFVVILVVIVIGCF